MKVCISGKQASTQFQGASYEKNGTFLVKEIKLELLNSTANHRLLKNIAENSNGGFYLPNQLINFSRTSKTEKIW